MLRKAILKPLSLGMELRLVKKSLLTLLHSTSLFDSHAVNTFSILCPDVHGLGEKTDYYFYFLLGVVNFQRFLLLLMTLDKNRKHYLELYHLLGLSAD